MNNPWLTEISRILLLLLSSLIFGYLTEQWIISLLIHCTIYGGWNIYQLWQFKHWISKGGSIKKVPQTSGVLDFIVQHFIRSKNSSKAKKKRLSVIANHYQAVMSALPDATIILNKNHDIEWANKPSRKILGIHVIKSIGQPISKYVDNLALHDLLSLKDKQGEIEIQSPMDILKTLSIAKVNYYQGKVLILARDVSQRIAIQKLRKDFISNASHELRTPLTVISGYMDVLDDDEDLPVYIKKVINSSLQQAIRMEKILDDILMLSKLEAKGYSDGRGKIIDIPLLLQRVVADFEATTEEDDYSFNLEHDPDLMLKIKEVEFYSLCQNLISNAVKYSRKKTDIDISWKLNQKGEACLTVVDHGEGIAKEHLSRLTERFYRINIERNKKIAGTGLGLSIVKHILDNYGARLKIKSKLNKGSTFSACFPITRVFSSNNK
ncbi:MAG: DUF3329 domain-containing protein [Gammaproteobacteria bacterium]|nr:DUF3329 domain-containing protein [Gammaproteobacteria bacterium]